MALFKIFINQITLTGCKHNQYSENIKLIHKPEDKHQTANGMVMKCGNKAAMKAFNWAHWIVID